MKMREPTLEHSPMKPLGRWSDTAQGMRGCLQRAPLLRRHHLHEVDPREPTEVGRDEPDVPRINVRCHVETKGCVS